MSQDRYFDILRYLHFSNNEHMSAGDRIFKIRNIWDVTNQNFKSLLNPHKIFSIDESLILHKGRLFFRQYIPNKASKFGIKTFSLVDEATKVILSSMIYSGKTHDLKFSTKEFGYGGAIVMQLMEPYLGLNHHIYCDNWFTSPNLALELLSRQTYLCGTIRKDRKNLDAPKTKMKKGEVIVKSANEVMTEFWRDKKIVSMISTIHNHEMKEITQRGTGNTINKPVSVLEYNAHARGIDQGDMMMHFYTMRKKCVKWYKKLFFHLVDICLYNAFRLFVNWKPPPKPMTFIAFRMNVIRQIMERYGLKENMSSEIVSSQLAQNPSRLSGRHFPSFNPPTSGKRHGSRKCRVCASSKEKTKETVYQCSSCKVPLCVVPCFEIYHTRKNIN
ncbi:PiggyBac transposable element-derived protein 4 [Folsomia candida]|uniref:PiggyBac transposable element-derived protein 4 n=1 Tax=Folsomia candida TaxID=158441 RepID=A0A226DDB4_FOLCA|nr:PiggyBac transposable element-derived protein 4 [Folsomia candida]